MIKKLSIVLTLLFLLVGIVVSFAQYSNSQQDPNAPPSLYPQPGPGELLIVDQLKETNRLLQQQIQLTSEQNQILIDTLEQVKKQAVNKTNSKGTTPQ